MGKGLAERRRLKRALDAAQGNLHKIQNGKALPKRLPEAPKPQDAEKLPASLRKMLALKEVAAKQAKKGPAAPHTLKASGRQGTTHGGKAREEQGDGGDGPSTSGRKASATTQAQETTAKASVTVKGGNAFTEAFEAKKLKERKKAYLQQKQEKKRNKGGSGELVVEKELQLRDNIKFGEVVHAPLNVHLKRKHWADKEKTANERCKEVFLKQMQQAQQRMQGQAADEGLQVAPSKRPGGGAGGAGGAHLAAKGKKRKADDDQETEELRLQVIESYRAAKRGGGLHNTTVGNATLSSLARLVGKSSGPTAAGAKTHTLA